MIIPDYKSASKNRLYGTYTQLEHFVTEWEPSAVEHDQCEIDQWRNDLAKVLAKVLEEEQKKMNPLFIIVVVAVGVQIAINLAFCLWRF